LLIPEIPVESLTISIERPHFETQVKNLGTAELGELEEERIYGVGELILERKVTAGFWAATIIFLGVLLIIAFEKLHSTTAALAGASAIFLVTFIAVAFYPGLYIFTFEQALTYMNWEVIFLVMGMMIIIAIVERTGIFQWMAFQAYRLSRGHSWLLVIILMALTAVASALLDNFTTMLPPGVDHPRGDGLKRGRHQHPHRHTDQHLDRRICRDRVQRFPGQPNGRGGAGSGGDGRLRPVPLPC
jgi:hypothetical protein